MELNTYKIPEENWDDFTKRLAKVAKSCAKLGITAPELTVVSKDAVEYKTKSGRTASRIWTTITLTPVEVKLAGWSLLGTLKHKGGANLLALVPGAKVPASFRTRPNICDHCGLKRARINTHLVGKGRVIKQVGSNCIADFLGHKDADAHAALLETLWSFDAYAGQDEDSWGLGGREPKRWPLVEFLSYTALAIRKEGWVPRSKALDGTSQPTSHHVQVALDDYSWTPKQRETYAHAWGGELEPSAADRELAVAVAEWLGGLGLKVRNDYLYNLAVIGAAGTVDKDGIGLAASAITAYQRAMGQAAERKHAAKATSESAHVGSAGERITFEGEVLFAKFIESDWGCSTLVKINAQGNVLVWFASGAKEFSVGQQVKGKATVKGHDEYQGQKQTKITRATLV